MRRRIKSVTAWSLAVIMTLLSAFYSFAASNWKRNGDVWNYYYSEGKMAKSTWVKSGDSLFWIEADGAMATGKWHEQDHKWYYLDASGAAVLDWKEINGKWYYFKEDYSMAADETIGSYYVGKDGAWVVGK